MIYDRAVDVFKLDTASSPNKRRLVLHSSHYCGPLTVYHRTHFEALQAGESVDRMVRIPGPAELPEATMYAILEDGHVYRVTQAQPTTDEDGQPVVNLSLHREEAQRYDLFRPGSGAEGED